jgi:hypothetical protein
MAWTARGLKRGVSEALCVVAVASHDSRTVASCRGIWSAAGNDDGKTCSGAYRTISNCGWMRNVWCEIWWTCLRSQKGKKDEGTAHSRHHTIRQTTRAHFIFSGKIAFHCQPNSTARLLVLPPHKLSFLSCGPRKRTSPWHMIAIIHALPAKSKTKRVKIIYVELITSI